jgi:hypothetical protein
MMLKAALQTLGKYTHSIAGHNPCHLLRAFYLVVVGERGVRDLKRVTWLAMVA